MAVEDLVETQRRNGTCPRGTYDSVIREIATVRRKDDGSHVLRVIVQTVGLERDLLVWQGLASDDKDNPFDLTIGQHRSLERFAARLGITEPLTPPSLVVDRLVGMRDNGVVVQAKVSQTKVGQRVTLSVPGPVDTTSDLTPEQTQAAELAHAAHSKVIEGLGAVRLGLAFVAEGCYLLHQSEGWRALGFDTLSAYLASPEITMSRSEFYRSSEIWQRYVLDGGVDAMALKGAGPSKLEVPLPALEQGIVSAEQAVTDATSMPRKDLRDHYAALVNGDAAEREPSRRRDAGSSGVPVSVARSLAQMLQRVLDEVGRPEQKRMSNALREAVQEVLELAHEHALDVEDASS